MRVDITVESGFKPSFKTESLKSKFDLQIEKVVERFEAELELPAQWNVGVIYGASGTGKTTIAKHLFGEHMSERAYSDQPIIEEVAPAKSINEITDVFNKVGFSSPPSWLKPYHVLSNGEKMRVDLAERILADHDIIVFDEFTSVVSRPVAKICSYAVAKSVRKAGKKFIGITCHEDVLDWLEPDWVLDTNTMSFQSGVRSPEKDPPSRSKSGDAKNRSGELLGNITI